MIEVFGIMLVLILGGVGFYWYWLRSSPSFGLNKFHKYFIEFDDDNTMRFKSWRQVQKEGLAIGRTQTTTNIELIKELMRGEKK